MLELRDWIDQVLNLYETFMLLGQEISRLPTQKTYQSNIYTNKIGDCLFIYLFVYLSICSAIGGQTARPKRLKFGG